MPPSWRTSTRNGRRTQARSSRPGGRSSPPCRTAPATFSAPLLVFPRKAPPTKPAEPKPPGKPDEKPKAAAGEAINVHDLPLPKDATQVEYKKIVQQLSFTSDKDYKTLAAELAPQLAAQGWKTDGRDLVGVSAILKRTRGDASLTFGMSFRALRADLGPWGLVVCAGLALLVPGAGLFAPLFTKSLYLSLASFHGYLELAAAALFFVRGRGPLAEARETS